MHVSSETEEKDFEFKPFKVSIHFHSEGEARSFYAVLENLVSPDSYYTSKPIKEVMKMIRSEIVSRLDNA
jgi:hypothetical protein